MRAAFAASLALGFGLTAAGGTQAFELTSPGYKPGDRVHSEQVFNDLGCTGGNLSPALAWKDPPKGTQSYLLTFYDPDAPTGSGWWHWVVYNLPKATSSLPKGAGAEHSSALPPETLQGRTDLGEDAYHGPCPALGDPPHRYVFTIYALKVAKLPVPADSSGAMVTSIVQEHLLGKAVFVAHYGRPKT